MLKILWKREEIPLSSTIFCYLILDFYVKRRIRFSLRDKRLFEITEVEITRVDCIHKFLFVSLNVVALWKKTRKTMALFGFAV